LRLTVDAAGANNGGNPAIGNAPAVALRDTSAAVTLTDDDPIRIRIAALPMAGRTAAETLVSGDDLTLEVTFGCANTPTGRACPANYALVEDHDDADRAGWR